MSQNIALILVGGLVLILVVIISSAASVIIVGQIMAPTLTDVVGNATFGDSQVGDMINTGQKMFYIALGVLILGVVIFVAVKLLYSEEMYSYGGGGWR